MKTKRHIIPLRPRSEAGDYLCADGELAEYQGFAEPDSQGGDSGGGDGGGDGGSGEEGAAPGPAVMEKLPAVRVEFALKRSVLPGWHTHPDALPTRVVEAGKERTEAGWGERAAALLERFRRDAERYGMLTEPVLALAALRLRGGGHVMPTPPVLLVACSEAPMVEGSMEFGADSMRMNVVAAVCRMQWRVELPEGFDEIPEEATHLDLFLSDPIPLYDRKGEMESRRRTTSESWTHSIGSDGLAGEHRVWNETLIQAWAPAAASPREISEAIAAAAEFRHVGEASLSDIGNHTEFTDLEWLPATSARYRPDYAHLMDVEAAGRAEFSGRVTLYDLTLTPPPYLPLRYLRSHTDSGGNLPRYLFHPDPEARAYLFSENGKGYSLPLRRHPTLYGSFYLRSLAEEGAAELPATAAGESAPGSRRLPAGVWRSEKGSRLLFPDGLLARLDVGRVMHICRAFRSSGLVATTTPTAYLFTDAGVFLLKESDDGSFRDAGLIGNYVLGDPSTVKTGGSTVEFTTADGTVMAIEGTKIKRIRGEGSGTGSTGTFALRGKGGAASFVTRALKLGDGERLKRLARVRVRGVFQARARIRVEGSRDLGDWHLVACSDSGEACGMWAGAFRYFRIGCGVELAAGETIEAIVVETY